MQYVIAFVTGGMICALSQILMEKTKMLPGRIMVLLVCLGAILGFVGIYEPFSQWAQAGANVPTGALLSTVSFNEGQTIPGIAHGVVLESCVSSAKKEG